MANMFVLYVFCIYFISQNISNYSKWTVITDVKTKDVNSLTFPAVTICLTYGSTNLKTISLNNEILAVCLFGSKRCQIDDFEEVLVWSNLYGRWDQLKCYNFNGGRNLHGNDTKLLKTTGSTDFRLTLNIKSYIYVWYYIGHNPYIPTREDIMKEFLLPDFLTEFIFKKTVDEKIYNEIKIYE